MRPPRPIPSHLTTRAFSSAEARAAGITPRMLQHRRFVRVFPSVYRVEDLELDEPATIAAGRLSLPTDARISHLTRLRLLGMDFDALLPLHFTIARELHLDTDDLVLHRTVKMPPCDGQGVVIPSAFIGAADVLRMIDLVCVGDWLTKRGLLDVGVLTHLAHLEAWRPGAAGAMAVLPHLDGRSRSFKESELRVLIAAAGLPDPEVNGDIFEDGEFVGCGDLVFRSLKLVVEYEGRHHAFDRRQFNTDIDRYRRFRRSGWTYIQVTQEQLDRPRVLVRRIHEEMVRQDFDGPDPVFGPLWHAAFQRIAGSNRFRDAAEDQRHLALGF